MKNSILKCAVFSMVFAASTASIVSGQTAIGAQPDDSRDRRAISAASSIYVISAKAGGVNYVEGKTTIARKVGKSGYLIKGDNIEVGDKVTTGADGKVEILLNPGSYARLGENTEFEFINSSSEDLKLKVTRGSVLFEIIGDREYRVAVSTPQSDFYLIKTGIYRLDAQANGAARLEVWKGNAQVGDGKTAILKSGQAAEVVNGAATVAKFERDDKDSLEKWSKDRSKVLAAINSKLDRRSARSSLLSSFGNWNMRDSFGLWMFDASIGSYCFMPFGYGWRSPYGHWFGRDIWTMGLPYYVYNSMYYPNVTNNNGGGSNVSTGRTKATPAWRTGNQGDGTGTGTAATERVKDRSFEPPPFTRVQRDMGGMIYSPGPDLSSPRGGDISPVRTERTESFPVRTESMPAAPSIRPSKDQ